jgi:hypothetical protein
VEARAETFLAFLIASRVPHQQAEDILTQSLREALPRLSSLMSDQELDFWLHCRALDAMRGGDQGGSENAAMYASIVWHCDGPAVQTPGRDSSFGCHACILAASEEEEEKHAAVLEGTLEQVRAKIDRQRLMTHFRDELLEE